MRRLDGEVIFSRDFRRCMCLIHVFWVIKLNPWIKGAPVISWNDIEEKYLFIFFFPRCKWCNLKALNPRRTYLLHILESFFIFTFAFYNTYRVNAYQREKCTHTDKEQMKKKNVTVGPLNGLSLRIFARLLGKFNSGWYL